jgi:hypothetical protein
MANKKKPPNPKLKVHKNSSLYLSRELPVSRLCCTSLVVAFSFSLINPTSYTSFGSSFSYLMIQFPGLRRQGPLAPAHNTSN